jgi:hypothetical protein
MSSLEGLGVQDHLPADAIHDQDVANMVPQNVSMDQNVVDALLDNCDPALSRQGSLAADDLVRR